MTKTNYGHGNDKWGWEFYRLTKGAYGTVLYNDKVYKYPKPKKLIWRPDRQITEYDIDGVQIIETKFISMNESGRAWDSASLSAGGSRTVTMRHTVSGLRAS